MADLGSTSVTQLRQMLVESGKFTQMEADAIKGKSNLVQAVLALNGDGESDDVSFEKLVVPETVELTEVETQTEPTVDSPDWHKYVMSQFTVDEIDDQYPNIYGLRRVSELLIGEIAQSGPTAVFPPNDANTPGRATCVYTVVFITDKGEKAYSAVGSAYPGNVDSNFAIYPEAIAEVRAEARALRKALKLRVCSSEEMPKSRETAQVKIPAMTGEWNANDKLSAMQEIFIKQKCAEMKIDITKFINHGDYKYESLDLVPRGIASTMTELLNKYQTNTKQSLDVPKEILQS